MHKNFCGWSLESINAGTVETKYTVEYINDARTWEKFCKTEDIELYSIRNYDNISEAISFYMIHFVNENCYDIKLWEQVFVNGEMVLEQMIEPQSTAKFSMRQSINREMENRMRKAEQETEQMRKTNTLLSGFVKMLQERFGKSVKELFEEYTEENAQ